ncbi:DMT family transporter [Halomonas sp. HP20-15]|uniref:DMT family transporter n=1 Tax=Halomonas sp. HP20-15 TaxID=3085901 RepID=UPI0029827BFF|nr:DMT family transporter [Halomonas sp. HP20-15]MDW5377512.1 DMT family transporter [Halomonas sp. HP20-15]
MKSSRLAPHGAAASTCPAQRRPVDGHAGLWMVLFCLALGAQQVAIKVVAGDIAPLAQVALRSLAAALLVLAIARWHGMRLADFRADLGPGLLVGLGFTGEFLFVACGLNYTLASHMSVFLYTAPVFAALGLHLWVPGEQLARRQWWGIAMAFAGMLIAMAPTTQRADAGAVMLGDALGLLAGLSWAGTTLVLRRSSLSEAPPVKTLCYQLIVAAGLLLPTASLLGDLEAIAVTGPVVASMAFQTLVISFGALLLWFALLRRYLASQLGVFSFLSPVFGVLFGAMLLNEPLTLNFIMGGVAILLGIVLVTR